MHNFAKLAIDTKATNNLHSQFRPGWIWSERVLIAMARHITSTSRVSVLVPGSTNFWRLFENPKIDKIIEMLLKLVSCSSLGHMGVEKKESLPIRIPETLVNVSTRISYLWEDHLPSSNNGASKSVGLLRLCGSHDCDTLVVKIEDSEKSSGCLKKLPFPRL